MANITADITFRSGFGCAILVYTGKEGAPIYFKLFMQDLERRIFPVFRLQAIYDISHSIAAWKDYMGDMDESGTLLQVCFTLDAGLNQKHFQEYCSMVAKEYIVPFCIGCGFTTFGNLYTYITPAKARGIAAGGNRTVMLHLGDMEPQDARQLFMDVFNVSSEQAANLEMQANMLGWLRLENALSDNQIPNFLEFTESIGLTHADVVIE